jgi:hypothetical protein
MNMKLGAIALALVASLAIAQEPPGCRADNSRHGRGQRKTEITGHLTKRSSPPKRRKKTAESDEGRLSPVIASVSPVYFPQNGDGTAITASGGYLFVVVGQKLYKVDEKTLKTVQVSTLGRVSPKTASDSEVPKRKKKRMASRDSGLDGANP